MKQVTARSMRISVESVRNLKDAILLVEEKQNKVDRN